MTLPGRYNIGGLGGYFSASYNSSNYNKSSSFSQDLKNRGYFLTLTTLNRSSRYSSIATSENSSTATNGSSPKESLTDESQLEEKCGNRLEESKSTGSSESNDDIQNDEQEVMFQLIRKFKMIIACQFPFLRTNIKIFIIIFMYRRRLSRRDLFYEEIPMIE